MVHCKEFTPNMINENACEVFMHDVIEENVSKRVKETPIFKQKLTNIKKEE